MHNIKIYLDTSFISHLEQEDAPEKMSETNELWLLLGLRRNVELMISSITLEEISHCNDVKRLILEERMIENKLLCYDEKKEDYDLAREYLNNRILSEKSFYDLRHIAIAVNQRCKYILSWNFRHFVNPRTINAINEFNKEHNLHEISIVSPSMLLGGF